MAQKPCWVDLESCCQRLNADDEAGDRDGIDADNGPSHTAGLSELGDSNPEKVYALGINYRKKYL